MKKEIYPIFEKSLSREEREKRLMQRGRVLWMTGLSGSGKSTLAVGLEKKWFKEGKHVYLLDGDNIRSGINKDLGFTVEDRKENIRRIAEVATLFKNAGWWVICSFVSPLRSIRNMAREIIGEEDFIEIWVSTSLEECERRDVKGLYSKARKGEIHNFTGISSPYEEPKENFISIDTEGKTVDECIAKIEHLI